MPGAAHRNGQTLSRLQMNAAELVRDFRRGALCQVHRSPLPRLKATDRSRKGLSIFGYLLHVSPRCFGNAPHEGPPERSLRCSMA